MEICQAHNKTSLIITNVDEMELDDGWVVDIDGEMTCDD
jgi:hypothetical protein